MTSYEDASPMEGEPPAPAPAPAPKKKREGVKMTDKQKSDLNKHMAKHKKAGSMTLTEQRSHRMKMMGRMRKGMTVQKAHNDIKKN